MKKIQYIGAIGALVLVTLSLAGCSVSEKEIEKYVDSKYNQDSRVLELEQVNEGNMGDTSAVVEIKDGIQFNVYMNGLFNQEIVGDDLKITKQIKGFNIDNLISKEDYELAYKNGFDNIELNLIKDIEKEKAYVELTLQGENKFTSKMIEPMYNVVSELKKKEDSKVPYGKIRYKQYTADFYYNNYGLDKFKFVALNKMPDSKEKFENDIMNIKFDGLSIVKSNDLTELTPLKNLPPLLEKGYSIGEEINKNGKKSRYIILEADSYEINQDKNAFIEDLVSFIDENELNQFLTKLKLYIAEDEYGYSFVEIPLDEPVLEIKESLKREFKKVKLDDVE